MDPAYALGGGHPHPVDDGAAAVTDFDDVEEVFHDAANQALASSGQLSSYAACFEAAAAAGIAAAKAASQRRVGGGAGVEAVISSLFPSISSSSSTHHPHATRNNNLPTSRVSLASSGRLQGQSASILVVGAASPSGTASVAPSSSPEEQSSRMEQHLWRLVRLALETFVPAQLAQAAAIASAGGHPSAAGSALPVDSSACDGLMQSAVSSMHHDVALADVITSWLEQGAQADVTMPPGLPHPDSASAAAVVGPDAHVDPMARCEDMMMKSAYGLDGPIAGRAAAIDGPLPSSLSSSTLSVPERDWVRQAEVMTGIWSLARAGRMTDAQALAVTAGRPWLAAVMDGARHWQDVTSEDDRDVATLRRGNPHSPLFMQTAAAVASQLMSEIQQLQQQHEEGAKNGQNGDSEDTSGTPSVDSRRVALTLEALLLTVLSGGAGGDDVNDNSLLPLADWLSWEDRLWLLVKGARDRLVLDAISSGDASSSVGARLRRVQA